MFNSELSNLEAENRRLKDENAELRRQLDFLITYPTLAQGLQGEGIVAALTGGVLTGYGVPHDVLVKSGERIEVKKARVRVEEGGNRRWIWHRLLGKKITKRYEWLVLVGEKDHIHFEQYPEELPWVFFLVPQARLDAIKSGDNIAISTNLAKATVPKAVELKKHLVRSASTFADLFRNAAP